MPGQGILSDLQESFLTAHASFYNTRGVWLAVQAALLIVQAFLFSAHGIWLTVHKGSLCAQRLWTTAGRSFQKKKWRVRTKHYVLSLRATV